jgi:hypothetical protein
VVRAENPAAVAEIHPFKNRHRDAEIQIGQNGGAMTPTPENRYNFPPHLLLEV